MVPNIVAISSVTTFQNPPDLPVRQPIPVPQGEVLYGLCGAGPVLLAPKRRRAAAPSEPVPAPEDPFVDGVDEEECPVVAAAESEDGGGGGGFSSGAEDAEMDLFGDDHGDVPAEPLPPADGTRDGVVELSSGEESAVTSREPLPHDPPPPLSRPRSRTSSRVRRASRVRMVHHVV